MRVRRTHAHTHTHTHTHTHCERTYIPRTQSQKEVAVTPQTESHTQTHTNAHTVFPASSSATDPLHTHTHTHMLSHKCDRTLTSGNTKSRSHVSLPPACGIWSSWPKSGYTGKTHIHTLTHIFCIEFSGSVEGQLVRPGLTIRSVPLSYTHTNMHTALYTSE